MPAKLIIVMILFFTVGQESDWLLAGTDPDLRYRVREVGYRIVVVPDCWAYHPASGDMSELARFAFKKGSYTAWQYRFARDLMYDAPDGHTGSFAAQTTLPYRIARKGLRIVGEVLTLRPFGLFYDICYSVGYGCGLVKKWK